MTIRRHLSTAELASATGFSTRWFTANAAAGRIPGAYQPMGPGGGWRFEERAFWQWWHTTAHQEDSSWRPSIAAVSSSGAASSDVVRTSESPLEQRLRQLRGAASASG